MTATTGWLSAGERGSLLWMRIAVWFHRRVSRRLGAWLILPFVAYFFLADRRGRRASHRYLQRLYACPQGRVALAHKPHVWDCFLHYREFGQNLLDRLCFWLGDFKEIEITLHGREHFAALLEEKRGAILLSAHIGSFDALRVLAEQGGVPVNVLMFTRHAQKINAIFKQLNPTIDLRVINLDPTSMQAVLDIKACLGRGEFVGILGDRVGIGEEKRISRVPFLGKVAAFPQGPFLLASALQCPVLLMIGLRANFTTYHAFVEPFAERVILPSTGRTEGLDELVAAYAKRLEEYCFRAPYQWFNFYDFWGDDAPADEDADPVNSFAWDPARD
jgi:predicted LPLAT superfamily acyltransferase